MYALFILSITLLYVSHPVMMAGVLIAVAIISSMLVGKISISWVFYLLALVFLGGVIVVLLFIVSVCANEKFFYYEGVNLGLFLFVAALTRFFLNKYRGLRFELKRNILPSLLYQRDAACAFITFIAVLVLCIIRVVKIRKLESGPLIKRLLKISIKITFYLQ